MFKFGHILTITALLWPQLGASSLARVSYDDLKKQVSLVIQASPVEIHRSGPNAGFAKLRVQRVILGQYAKEFIEIKWGGEEHDQSIANLDADYLLLLRQNENGEMQGAAYGRSFWPIPERVVDPSRVNWKNLDRDIHYQSPITAVSFSAKQKKNLFRSPKILREKALVQDLSSKN